MSAKPRRSTAARLSSSMCKVAPSGFRVAAVGEYAPSSRGGREDTALRTSDASFNDCHRWVTPSKPERLVAPVSGGSRRVAASPQTGLSHVPAAKAAAAARRELEETSVTIRLWPPDTIYPTASPWAMWRPGRPPSRIVTVSCLVWVAAGSSCTMRVAIARIT